MSTWRFGVASSETPERRSGSWRRTTSIDLLRPDGPDGPLVLDCRGRDLFTSAGGSTHVADAVEFRVRIDYAGSGEIDQVTGDEVVAPLVGVAAVGGFRRSVAARIGDAVVPGSVLALLLDEIPVVTMISRAALSDREIVGMSGGPAPSLVGICSGWQEGGRLADAVARTGLLPTIDRPPAPPLQANGDPLAWHRFADELPVGSMRRLRRFDLMPSPEPEPEPEPKSKPESEPGPGKGERAGSAAVESLFRDSLSHAERGHVVVHEYAVTARIDLPAATIAAIWSEPHVLPAPECPVAAASAGRLVGRRLGELRESVRQDFVGTGTCTHLNDHLRGLGDLGRLLSLAPPA